MVGCPTAQSGRRARGGRRSVRAGVVPIPILLLSMLLLLVPAAAAVAQGDDASSGSAAGETSTSAERPAPTSADDDEAAPPTKPDTAAPPAEVIHYLERRFEEARYAYETGSFRRAWRLCEAILVLAPDVPFRADLRRLRREAQGRYLAKSVVVVAFHPADDLTFPATELRGDVVIENHSPETISVGRAENDPVLGMVHFRVRTLDAPGDGESAEEGTRLVRMPEEIGIDPGQEHRISVTIPLDPVGAGGETWMQRWMVGGALRPITVRAGKAELTRGIPWVPAQGILVPEDLADVPNATLQHLRRAMLTGDRRRFTVASHLWWLEIEEEDPGGSAAIRTKLIEELLVGLDRPDGWLDGPIIRMLERLTGVVRERTAQSWKIWGLTRRRASPPEEER